MKKEPINCRADNALAARCQSFAARWACVCKRPFFYLAAYIDGTKFYDSSLFKMFSLPSLYFFRLSPLSLSQVGNTNPMMHFIPLRQNGGFVWPSKKMVFMPGFTTETVMTSYFRSLVELAGNKKI